MVEVTFQPTTKKVPHARSRLCCNQFSSTFALSQVDLLNTNKFNSYVSDGIDPQLWLPVFPVRPDGVYRNGRQGVALLVQRALRRTPVSYPERDQIDSKCSALG
eukprot:g6149.t1